MGDGINSIPVAFCWKFPVWKAVRRHCHNMSWGHGYVKEGTCDSYNESSFRSKGQRSELDRNNLLYIYYINNIYMWFFRSQLPERVFTIAEYDCYGLLWAVGPSGVFGKKFRITSSSMDRGLVLLSGCVLSSALGNPFGNIGKCSTCNLVEIGLSESKLPIATPIFDAIFNLQDI